MAGMIYDFMKLYYAIYASMLNILQCLFYILIQLLNIICSSKHKKFELTT